MQRFLSMAVLGAAFACGLGWPSQASTTASMSTRPLAPLGLPDPGKRTDTGPLNAWRDTAAYEVAADADVLRFTIKNTGAADKFDHLTMLTSVQAEERIAPLSPGPQASMLALMAVGLVATTFPARRRPD